MNTPRFTAAIRTLSATLALPTSKTGSASITPVFFTVASVFCFTTDAPLLAASSYVAPEAASTVAEFLTQANAQGTNGYRFRGDFTFGVSTTIYALYGKDTTQNSRYTNLAPSAASSLVNFLLQANTLGTNGFAYQGDFVFGSGSSSYSVYVKDRSKTAIITNTAPTAATDIAGFLAQANAQGSNGFVYQGNFLFGSGASIYSLYVKDRLTNAMFSYRALASTGTQAEFVAQANAQGSNSYVYFGDYAFDNGSSIYSIYVKDSSKSLVFSYNSLPAASDLVGFLSQANTQGSNSFAYIGDFEFGGGFDISSLFMKAESATPLGYNQISSRLLSSGDVTLSFVGLTGTNYVLLRSPSLSSAIWSSLATNRAGGGGSLIFTNTPNRSAPNYWRIKSLP